MESWIALPQAWRAWASKHPDSVLLETARFDAKNRHSYLYWNPVRILFAETLDSIPKLLHELDCAVAEGLYAAGYLSYECGYAFQPGFSTDIPKPSFPWAWFGLYSEPIIFDHATGSTSGLLPDLDGLETSSEIHSTFTADTQLQISQEEYFQKINCIQEYIRCGDTYQVNFTDRVSMATNMDAAAAYTTLLAQQPVSHAAWIHLGLQHILSFSPELFFRIDSDRITTRPMKGTLRRGRDGNEDRLAAKHLRQDEKNCSEHVMIVDLLRNDLGRICAPGTVQVQNLFQVERYATLLQMTSTICGMLRPHLNLAEIFSSLFPSGSITGAPKIRTMQIIQELEASPRGVYTGAIGHVQPGGKSEFSVAIRTLELHGVQALMGVGGGIVADSSAASEWQECLLKSSFLTRNAPKFSLIETLLWDGTAASALPLHLDRIESSAQYFDFVCDRDALSAQILTYCQHLPQGKRHRVRVVMDAQGQLTLRSSVLENSEWTGRIRMSAQSTNSHDLFLRHKTTHRTLYEQELAAARAEDFDEVLFLNERGECTEGAISNLFWVQDGQWRTPALDCGVLPGIFRQQLLRSQPNATECVVTLHDLCSADAIFFCSAVRGLRPVQSLWAQATERPLWERAH